MKKGEQTKINDVGDKGKMSAEDKALIKANNERNGVRLGKTKDEQKPIDEGLFAPPPEPTLFDK